MSSGITKKEKGEGVLRVVELTSTLGCSLETNQEKERKKYDYSKRKKRKEASLVGRNRLSRRVEKERTAGLRLRGAWTTSPMMQWTGGRVTCRRPARPPAPSRAAGLSHDALLLLLLRLRHRVPPGAARWRMCPRRCRGPAGRRTAGLNAQERPLRCSTAR